MKFSSTDTKSKSVKSDKKAKDAKKPAPTKDDKKAKDAKRPAPTKGNKKAKDAKKTAAAKDNKKAKEKTKTTTPAKKGRITPVHEDRVQQWNKWAWVFPLIGGILSIIAACWYLFWMAVLAASCNAAYAELGLGVCVSASVYIAEGVWWFISGALGIVAGIMARATAKPKVAAKDYAAAQKPLIIWGIVGAICVGSGALLILQFIFIKLGEKK
ncbi:MAG TPA: hypothetical protein VKK79_02010 [Candidatus Lokiarchaeia archaeon]|nr:hypothetical protein [Candidatus Lokiarchaeia archaeon]